MKSLHLVDPALRPLLEMFPTNVLSHENLAELRAAERSFLPPIPPNSVELKITEIEGPDGNKLPLHIFLPPASASRPMGCIYHIHGGGYVGGSPSQYEFFLRPLAEELGCAIVSVDYRLAPENPHPAPVEDCYAGLSWTLSNAGELGIDPSRIGIMGESAGGGLAAALALLVRDRGLASLAFQLLTYPMIDDRTCTSDPPHMPASLSGRRTITISAGPRCWVRNLAATAFLLMPPQRVPTIFQACRPLIFHRVHSISSSMRIWSTPVA